MKEFIEKLIARLEEEYINCFTTGDYKYNNAIDKTIEIVNQLAEEYNKKQEHEVWLNGCDDDTIFTMEMTNNEYEFLKRVSELANETSTYGCMPRLYVEKAEMIEPKGE